MRREVSTPLSNEKVTYIKFQDDLWVTFDPWLFIFQGGFWPFIFPKWLFEFLFSFNYNNSENMKTLHIPQFWIFYKNKYLQYFTKVFYNIILQYYNFDSPFFRKCLLHALCWDNIFSSLELKICAFFTSRSMLHFLYSSILITNFCMNAV